MATTDLYTNEMMADLIAKKVEQRRELEAQRQSQRGKRFKDATTDEEKQTVYEEALIMFHNQLKRRYDVQKGRKWDTFLFRTTPQFNIDKKTGDVWHKGKRPEGNIFNLPYPS